MHALPSGAESASLLTWFIRHADSFGAAGFLTVAPDLFNGHPSPDDLNEPGFDLTKFLEGHGPEITDPLIAKGIRYLKEEKGVEKVVVRRPPLPPFSFCLFLSWSAFV